MARELTETQEKVLDFMCKLRGYESKTCGEWAEGLGIQPHVFFQAFERVIPHLRNRGIEVNLDRGDLPHEGKAATVISISAPN